MLKDFLFGNEAERSAKQVIQTLGRENNLNPRKRRKLEEAKTKRRGLLLRQMIVFGGLTFASATAVVEGFTGRISNSLNPSGDGFSLAISSSDGFGKEKNREIEIAAYDWNKKFRCKRPVTVEFGSVEQDQNDPNQISQESAIPGIITIDRNFTLEPRYIILHAMTHACASDTPTMLDNPVKISDATIIGHHGFTLLVVLQDGSRSKFTLIEEGHAERLASAFPDYLVKSTSYFNIGNLARRQLPLDKYPNVYDWLRKNDVPAVIRASLGLPMDTQLNSQHYERIVSEYDSTYKKSMPMVR